MESFLAIDDIKSSSENVMYCVEPDFKKFINPVQIRRMSRALKMGFSAAIDCLNKSQGKRIDAIIIGTGKGCLVDTESFLHSIRQYEETALNPTHFIHSTYNQLNGMIALDQKINSYNVTYAHRGFSFEHSLFDASLLIDAEDASYVLLGSFDEMTPEHYHIKKIWGYWKTEFIESSDLLLSESAGTIAGEGSSFFVLSDKKSSENQVSVLGIKTLYAPSEIDLIQCIERLLFDCNIDASNVDILMLGNNGNANQIDHQLLLTNRFPGATALFFKHLCGEYDTASQFGFWLLSKVLQEQIIPEVLYHPLEKKRYAKEKITYALLYNNYFESNQSLILMKL